MKRLICFAITGVVSVCVAGSIAGSDIVVGGMSQIVQWTKPFVISTSATIYSRHAVRTR